MRSDHWSRSSLYPKSQGARLRMGDSVMDGCTQIHSSNELVNKYTVVGVWGRMWLLRRYLLHAQECGYEYAWAMYVSVERKGQCSTPYQTRWQIKKGCQHSHTKTYSKHNFSIGHGERKYGWEALLAGVKNRHITLKIQKGKKKSTVLIMIQLVFCWTLCI